MKLRHLLIKNFRGIRSLDWMVACDFACLIGAGDSGKSTILDAIELVLSPRWNPLFDDSDFYNGSSAESIVIEATMGQLSSRLLSDGHFGLRLRGLSPAGTLNDEPQDEDEEVITIRLTVDSSLEPKWEVVTDRHPEGAPIHGREREQFGVVRLGAVVDRHLSWSRGSVLARLTGETDEHSALLADAGRKARSSIDLSTVPKLETAAREAASLASAFGVSATTGFHPGLDPGMGTLGSGGILLHDGPVPVRRAGLGTRRLVALAVQREIARSGGIVLIDELEHGLEPFRVRRLLRELLEPTATRARETEEAGPKPQAGVVVVTTHSPIVLGELGASQLRVVRRVAGVTAVLTPTEVVQPVFRSNAEAFLSRRVVVCEGRTELGLLRGLDQAWSATGEPFAARGVALADGGGCSKVGGMATVFAELAYPTAIVADDDAALDIDPSILSSKGIVVVQWADKMALEQRIFADLPWSAVVEAVRLAMVEHDERQIRANIATALKASPSDLPTDPAGWHTWRAEEELRAALGAAAKAGAGWYKRVDRGAALGRLVAKHLPSIGTSDLATKIASVREWIFRE